MTSVNLYKQDGSQNGTIELNEPVRPSSREGTGLFVRRVRFTNTALQARNHKWKNEPYSRAVGCPTC